MVGIRVVETCQVEDKAAKISGYDSSASYYSHNIDSIELSVSTLKSSRFRFESFLLLMLGIRGSKYSQSFIYYAPLYWILRAMPKIKK